MLVKAAVGGVALEYVYAYMVSDVLSGARMYLARLAVSLVAVASLDDAESTDKGRIRAYPPSSRALYVLLFSLPVGSFSLQFCAGGIIAPVANHVDPQAQQLAVADFIKKRLSPTDGAVGVKLPTFSEKPMSKSRNSIQSGVLLAITNGTSN
jgi:hypothetical protein